MSTAASLVAISRRLGLGRWVDPVRKAVDPCRKQLKLRWNPQLRRELADSDRLRAIIASVLRADSDCVDVGAHSGTVLADIIRAAPAGTHVAFEPIPALAADLKARFPVIVHAQAVGSASARTQFHHVVNAPYWSGLRARDYGGARVRVEMIDVEVVTLDEALPAGYRPAFIKVDTEGGDLDVLRGGIRTLRACDPLVIIEFGRGAADRYDNSEPDDLMELLRSINYRLFDLDGNGPYDQARLRDVFDRKDRWNFILHR